MARTFLFTISARHLMASRTKDRMLQREVQQARSAIGNLQLGDVGKHVYLVAGIIQCESAEQRDKRLGK